MSDPNTTLSAPNAPPPNVFQSTPTASAPAIQQQGPSHYAPARHYHNNYALDVAEPARSAPAQGGSESDSDECHSCCKSTFLSPFKLRSYASLFMNLVVDPAFGMFTLLWVGILFGFSWAFLFFFPIGPILMMLSIASWRWLAKLELVLHKYTGGGSRVYNRTGLCYGGDVWISSRHRSACSWDGFWGTLKDMMLNKDSWKPVLYFLFVKPFVFTFNFGLTLGLTAVSLALTFNFLALATCNPHMNDSASCFFAWVSSDWTGSWVVDSYKGSAITVPLGVLLFCFTCMLSVILARKAAKISLFCLGKAAPPHGDETTPMNRQIQPHQHPHSAPATHNDNRLFTFSAQQTV